MGESIMIIANIEKGRVIELLTDPETIPSDAVNVTDLETKPEIGWFHLGGDQFKPFKRLAYAPNGVLESVQEVPQGTRANHEASMYEIDEGDPQPGWVIINGKFKPVRIISTGAMQRRFTIAEEAAIESGADVTAKVIRSRLLNASYCDLDFQDTIDGVAYICNYLEAQGIITGKTTRIAELLSDGTITERYKGEL